MEAHAAAVFLRDGEFWDEVEAAGYRFITSLHSAPVELRGLPLGDRLYIRSVNERIGIGKDAREAAVRAGGMYIAVSRLAQLGLDQYHSQRSHPSGIQDFMQYMDRVGFSMYVPVGGSMGELGDDSDLRLAPSHPGLIHTAVPQAASGVCSLTRPRTQLAELCHVLKPGRRAWVEKTIPDWTKQLERTQGPCTKAEVYMAGIIPFGDMYKARDIAKAVLSTPSQHCSPLELKLQQALPLPQQPSSTHSANDLIYLGRTCAYRRGGRCGTGRCASQRGARSGGGSRRPTTR